MKTDISLTNQAQAKAEEFFNKLKGDSLRLYIAGKGCLGFEYGVTIDDASAEDFVFPQPKGPNLVIDSDTFVFLKGATIDWVDDDRGLGFLVENPNHKKFKGKFYKQPRWREYFSAKSANSDVKTDD